MRHLCLISVWFLYLLALPFSVGFNYSNNPPKAIFNLYDWVVVEPLGIKSLGDIKRYYRAKIFAYVSIGEREKTEKIDKNWIMGQNKFWNSYIMNIENKNYRKFLFDKLEKLKQYDGFMFDTIDSYQMVLKSQKSKKKYEKALIDFIKQVHQKFPNKQIILNRGFEIIPSIKNDINAVVAEDLFTNVNKNRVIIPNKPSDVKWLLNKLEQVKKMGLKVIVIDYINPNEDKKAEQLVRKIAKLGFIPFVSNLDLNMVGFSTLKLIPRKILVLYKGNPNDPRSYDAHTLYSMPLEFLGYIPVLKSVDEPLPKGYLNDKYAGIVVALEGEYAKNQVKFFHWIDRNIKNKMKIVFLSGFGFEDNNFYKHLDIKTASPKDFNYKLIYQNNNISDFEITPNIANAKDATILTPYGKFQKIIEFQNQHNQHFVTSAYMPWGGYCINPIVSVDKKTLWAINPFKFFKTSLNLKNIPLPDATTENGNRIFTSHIDGDGFADKNMVVRKYAPEVLYENVFTKYHIPISASIIEGEVAPYGLYPKSSKQLIKIAKKIYRLNNIEPASHAFSHPFRWDMKNPPRLPIKNYTHFSIKREILGSMKFIQTLLPKNKKIRLFFWTGDCMPQENALKLCYEHHILSINGGDTTITKKNPFISNIMPLGVHVGPYFQVYAPITNENIYTNLWHNKAGFVQVVQTIKLTGYPRRIKPIGVYYHFYTGSTTQSLMALKYVYNWVLKQQIMPMFISKWIKIVHDYEDSVVAKDLLDGSIVVKNDGYLRTVKLKGKKIIDFQKSENVVGEKYELGWTYISLSGDKNYKIVFSTQNNLPYLISANARIKKYKKYKNGYEVEFEGWLPLDLVFKQQKGCSIQINNRDYKKIIDNKKVEFKFKKSTSAFIKVKCD